MALSSQRSRSGFTSFSITDGSGTGWFKNSGATSGPPVSNNPCNFSKGILRLAAFRTFTSGLRERKGEKYFSSERRIQVARLRVAQIAVVPSERQPQAKSNGSRNVVAKAR